MSNQTHQTPRNYHFFSKKKICQNHKVLQKDLCKSLYKMFNNIGGMFSANKKSDCYSCLYSNQVAAWLYSL